MRPLLRIQSTPIQIEYQSTRAMLNIQVSRPRLTITRKTGGLSIQTQPAQVTISSRGMRESLLALKPISSLMKEYAQEGIRAAREATAALAEEGNAMADFQTTSVADIVARRFIPHVETVLAFIPQNGVEMTVTEPQADIRYTPDDIQYDWELQSPQVTYIPYQLSMFVTQYPRVDIEYLGEPLYFPPQSGSPEQQKNTQR